MTRLFLAFLFALAAMFSALADEWKFPCPQAGIARYTAYYTHEPIRVDGRLDEATWQKAPQSPRFTDIISGARTTYDTTAAVLWDSTNLYVAYRVEEPFVRASFTNRNAPIWQENDLELFVAGRDAYYEFEINAFNTIYEVFFIWEEAYERGGFAMSPEFARTRLTPFNGVDFKNHPRGKRLGHFDWHFPGLQTAVSVDGTINDDRDKDRGWTVELALPWKGMEWLAKADQRSLPPMSGDAWRMDFSRFNKNKATSEDSGGWVWTRHGIWDSHIPECFAHITFSSNDVAQASAATKQPQTR